MTYFIFWVLFLLVVILSVPIASFLEKRQRQAALGPVDEAGVEFDDAEDEAVAVEEGEAEFAPVDEEPVGGDEFAEFEEIR